MDAKPRHEAVNVLESRAFPNETEEQIRIKRKLKGWIHTSSLLEKFPLPERGWLLQVESAVEIAQRRERRLPSIADVAPIA